MENIGQLLEASDIVINTLPYTKETHEIINEATIAQMKDGVVFVNVGRGKTVDSEALMRALKRNKISSAMIDAVEPEPLPAGHEMWKLDNVLVSPHMSADSDKYMDRAFRVFSENVNDFKLNKTMKTEVDLKNNY